MENKQQVADRRRKMKEILVQYMGGKCHRCGWNEHQAGLVPHHVDPSKKSFSLGSSGKTLAWKNIQPECQKCILLCQNCHAVIHAVKESFYFDERNIPDYGEYFDESGQNGPKCNHCIDCNKEINLTALRCRKCAGRENAGKRYKIKWPELVEVQNLVATHGYLATAKMLGVSDNAVRKHLKAASPRIEQGTLD